MSVEVKVPTLPESVPDATLLEWKKQAGEPVSRDEILIELETDKVVLEVPAPESGVLVEILKNIPKGSRVCNVAFQADHFFFCPLVKIGGQKSAPVYAHTGQKLVSTIIPGELGIPVLNNIHHAWPHTVNNADGSTQLYLLIHGWNKGKYAVLKHEPAGAKNADASKQYFRVVQR